MVDLRAFTSALHAQYIVQVYRKATSKMKWLLVLLRFDVSILIYVPEDYGRGVFSV